MSSMISANATAARSTEKSVRRPGLPGRSAILPGMNKIKIENHLVGGGAWVAAWLFTIGYLHLDFWQGVLALIIWPYYLGLTFSALP